MRKFNKRLDVEVEFDIQMLRNKAIYTYIKKYLHKYVSFLTFTRSVVIKVTFQKRKVTSSVIKTVKGYEIIIPWAIHNKKHYYERKELIADSISDIYLLEKFGTLDFEGYESLRYQFKCELEPKWKRNNKVKKPNDYKWDLFRHDFIIKYYPTYFDLPSGNSKNTKGWMLRKINKDFIAYYGEPKWKRRILQWKFEDVVRRIQNNRKPTEYEKNCLRIYEHEKTIEKLHKKYNNDSSRAYMNFFENKKPIYLSRRPLFLIYH